MKHEIKIIKSETEPDEVIVENFELFRNRHGYWCYRFDTPNNKRLEDCMYSVNEIWFGTEWGSNIIITLIPETQEEQEELDETEYNYCIRHLRWEFEVLRVPTEDFLRVEELEEYEKRNEKMRTLRKLAQEPQST
mgnify:CR=1 FL=1